MKTKLLLLILLAPFIAFGQITQIGQDIDGEAAFDLSGHCVSLSTNGNIMAVGAPFNDGNGAQSGHARVFEHDGSTWTQIGQDIDGEAANDDSAYALSLSADGSIIVIGAYANDGNGSNSGHARVFEYDGSNWTQMGQDLDGEASGDEFGSSVSINDDGSIVAVSGPLNDGNGINSGHVRVYEYDGSIWNQKGQDIDGEAAEDKMGYWNGTLDLNASGNIVAIGSHLNDGNNGDQSGHVRVFEYSGGNWTQIGADIDGKAENDNSGYSLSLRDDGSMVAIGSPRNDSNGTDSGHVRVYKYNGSTWNQIGTDIEGEAEFDRSGDYVSLNSNGNLLAIGAPQNDGNGSNAGHVRIYQNIGGSWTQIGQDIDGEAATDISGTSVSLIADGSIVAIGAPNNDANGTNSGHVRVFDLSSVLEVDDYSSFDFSIYPSPTSGILNINSETTISRIEIYNILGQMVKSNTSQNIIDISSVSQGIYFVKVMDENGNIGSQKVVKK